LAFSLGVGGDLAAWISYAVSKRWSKKPDEYGKGRTEGLIDAGASNNAGLSSAWVPALVFGIPGDAVTAIAIGVLFMQGLNPGPTLFTEQAPTLYAVFLVFLIANIIMVPLGLIAIRLAHRILSVPPNILYPTIFMFCLVGAFAINNTVFGIGIMLLFGAVGYFMEENGFPVAPLILGLILGPLVERTMSQASIISRGEFLPFLERPMSLVLGLLAMAVWAAIFGKALSPLWKKMISSLKLRKVNS
jgi:Uncharacterized protein conserved in bacteria